MMALARSAPFQSPADGFALGDFWTLTQQAGPLRWPIFFVLGFGLIQVFVKLFELLRDKRVSKALYAVDFSNVSLSEITRLVARQDESMLSSLQSTMLNVFQTRPGEGLLHDEISNFVAFRQDQFNVFRGRMEFLSDTAGALGLMGTVWGMFTVFFQGTAQQDVILRGMGIALITTLLGLVVSIILNFASTELSTFFNRRLENVSAKSDELRFRLMELAPKPGVVPAAAVPAPRSAPRDSDADALPPAGGSGGAVPPVGRAKTAPSSQGSAPPPQPAPAEPKWRYVDISGGERRARAGETLKDLDLVVSNGDGKPAAGVPVVVSIPGAEGSLDDGVRQLRTSSDEAGVVRVVCTMPESVGTFALNVGLSEQPGPPTRLEIPIGPAEPHRIEAAGNNQAAVAGMRLPLPLGVGVFDRFGNPVPDVSVSFKVTHGGGKLGAGKQELTTSTDARGLATTPFVVSSEAGQNLVIATVAGTKQAGEFVAFGTQV